MKGVPANGVHSAGAVFRIIFGSPVDPELQIPLSAGGMTSGSGEASDEADSAAIWGSETASSTNTGSMTSSRRRCSHSGRSQRIGVGTAPSFQVARVETINSTELAIDSATIEPSPTDRV